MATPDRLARSGQGGTDGRAASTGSRQGEPLLDFAAVVRRHGAALWRRALWLTRSDSDAADLFQETMERAIRGTGHYIETDALSKWLYTIMHNAFLDHRRAQAVRRNTQSQVRAIEQIPEDEPTTPQVWRTIDDDVVRGCVQRLPVPLREVFELHSQGVSYSDIGLRLGIPTTTVGTRLLRARRRLRDLLITAAGVSAAAFRTPGNS